MTLGVNIGVFLCLEYIICMGAESRNGSWNWTLKGLKVQYEELGLYPEGSGESVERFLSKRVT